MSKYDSYLKVPYRNSVEWLSGDHTMNATWSQNTGGDLVTLQSSLQTPIAFGEAASQATDATVYYAIQKVCPPALADP